MTRLLAAAALALAPAPAGAWSLFAKEKPAALIWIPAESFSDWEGLERILERHDDLGLTVGLTPAMSAAVRGKLATFQREGRLEIGLRLPGDPPLPLIHSFPGAPRPEDPRALLAAARDRHRAVWGASPEGFLPGGGEMSPAILPALTAAGLRWTAIGDYPAPELWAIRGEVALVPCRGVRVRGRELERGDFGGEETSTAAVLLDENDRLVPEGAFLRFASSADSRKVLKRFRSVSRSVRDRQGTPAGVPSEPWPQWNGSGDPLSRTPAQSSAWQSYGEAARALAAYQQSGSAQLAALEAATSALHAAQARRLYLGLASPERALEAEGELRRHLGDVYRHVGQPSPDRLLSSFGGGATESAQAPASARGGVRVRQGSNWVSFGNPKVPKSTGTSEPYAIEQFRVEWDEQEIRFIYRLGSLPADPQAPRGFGQPLVHTYIDLNHVVGAGSTRMLESASASIATDDAWEAALTVSGWGFWLHRLGASGEPILAERGEPAADVERREIAVRLPRALLRGNPAKWGYLVAATSVRPEADGRRNVRGLLGTIDAQRRASKAAGTEAALPAVRAP